MMRKQCVKLKLNLFLIEISKLHCEYRVVDEEEKKRFTVVSALGYLIGPHAHTCFTIVCEAGAALVSRSFAVPAIPENVTFLLIGENTIKTSTVGRGDWWFEL